MKRFTFLATLMMLFLGLNAQVFMTELADPNNNANVRYIELYNAGATAVDFTENSGWRLDKYTNASATVSQTLSLTGTIPAGGFYIIATGTDDGDFMTVYGVSADQFDGENNNVAGSNGDDNIELYDGNGTLIDQFGVPGEDGTNTNHEFEDGRAERIASVTTGNPTWDVAEWDIDNDGASFPGSGTQDAPDGFDPREWIGAPSTTPALTWASTTFTEDAANNGTIGNQIDLVLANETFATVGTLLTEGTDYTVNNVPTGLTVEIIANSTTSAGIELSGTATSHINDDDIANLEITFTDAAFTGGDASVVESFSKIDLIVDFDDPAATANLDWSGTIFNEDIANNGGISNTFTLTLTNESFATVGASLTEGTDYIVNNVPAGLTVEIETTDANNATISLTGTANSHLNTDDVTNLTITFENAAFAGGNASIVENYSKTDLVVDFIDPPVLTWDANTFVEDIANNGSFTMDITLSLTDETFSVSGGTVNLEAGTHYNATNVPAGLTLNIDAHTSTSASITLQSNADSHLSTDNISDLTITFLDAAFTNYTAADVANSNNNGISVYFFNPFSTPDLVISEIMYNGPESGTDSIEFIEVYNNTTEDVNLLGYTMEGVTHTFGDVTITAQSYGVLCYNSDAYNNTYGLNTIAWTNGGLSNGGETIKILDPVGNLIDEVTYGNSGDWPSISNSSANLGHSIVLCDYTSDNNVGTNWRLSLSPVGIQIDGKDVYASPREDDDACNVSTGKNLENSTVSIYPNPTTGIFSVEGLNISKVEILDITGRTIKTVNNKFTFDLSNENAGIYFVKIHQNNSVLVRRLIIE